MSTLHTEFLFSRDPHDDEADYRAGLSATLRAAHQNLEQRSHALGRVYGTLPYITIIAIALFAAFAVFGHSAEGVLVGALFECVSLVIASIFIPHRINKLAEAHEELESLT